MTSKNKDFDSDIELFDDDISDEGNLSDDYSEQKSLFASPRVSNARRSLEMIFEQRELERQIYDDFAV